MRLVAAVAELYSLGHSRMRNPRHKWYTPVFLLAWAGAWIYFSVHLLSGGEVSFRWYSGATRILVRSDVHPYYFWACVCASFLLALIGMWGGIVELRKYLLHHDDVA